MDVNFIALDLDGTTLNSENKLTEKVKAALIAAARLGIEIVPVTGRCFKSLPPELLTIDNGQCIHYAITSNGAEIRNAQTGEVLYSDYIGCAGIEEIKEVLDKREIMTEIYVKGSAHIEKKYYDRVDSGLTLYRNRDYVLMTRVPVKGVVHLLDVHRNKIEKVAVYYDENSDSNNIKEAFSVLEHVHVTSSGSNNVELTAIGCCKAKALKELCRGLSIPFSELAAIGDSQNDIEMLDIAGIAVAAGNADEAVKAHADFITASNDRDGVAMAVERLRMVKNSGCMKEFHMV